MSGPAPRKAAAAVATRDFASAQPVAGRGPFATSASSGLYAAAGNAAIAQAVARPRALDESFSPQALSDEELLVEQMRLAQWLEAYQASSTERVRAEAVLAALRIQLAQRTAKALGRPVGALLGHSGSLDPAAAFASAGFASGFLQGLFEDAAEHPDRVPALIRLQDELGQPLKRGAFGAGCLYGVHKGILLGFVDNVVGLARLAGLLVRYGTPLGWAYGAAQQGIDFVLDRNGSMARQAEEARARRELAVGTFRFAEELQKDPSLLVDIAEALGMEAGQASAQWMEQRFMAMEPLDKGIEVGEFAGRVLIEVVLLFVGPEVVLAEGAAAAGRAAMRLERVEGIVHRLVPVLERIPVLRYLLKLRGAPGAGAAAEGAGVIARETGATAPVSTLSDVDRSAASHAWSEPAGTAGADPALVRPTQQAVPDLARVESQASPLPAQVKAPSAQRAAEATPEDPLTVGARLENPAGPTGASRPIGPSADDVPIQDVLEPTSLSGPANPSASAKPGLEGLETGRAEGVPDVPAGLLRSEMEPTLLGGAPGQPAVATRRVRGLRTGRADPGAPVRPGTLEDLESVAHKPVGDPTRGSRKLGNREADAYAAGESTGYVLPTRNPDWKGRLLGGHDFGVQAGHMVPKSTGTPGGLAIELTTLNQAAQTKLINKEAVEIGGAVIERETALLLLESGQFPNLTREMIASAPKHAGWIHPKGMSEAVAQRTFMDEQLRIIAEPSHPLHQLSISTEEMAAHLPTRPMIMLPPP